MGSSSSDDDDTNTRLDDGVLSDGGFSYGYTDNDASSHFSGNAMSPPIISRAGSTRTSRHFASGQVTRSSSQRLLGGAPASRMPSTHSTNAISAAFAAAAAAISAQTSSITTTTTTTASLTTTTITATTTTAPTVPVTPSTSAPPPVEPPKSPSGGGSAASRIASLPKVIKRMSLPRLRRSSTVNDSKSSKETAAIPDSPMPAWPPSIPQQQQQQLQQPLQRLPSVSASTSANGTSLPVKSMPNSRAPSRAVSPTTMLQTAQQQQMPPLPPVPSEPSYQQLQQLQQSTGTLLEVPDSAVGITSPIMSPASAALPSVTSPGLSALSVYGAIPSSEVDNTLVANRIEDDDQREKVKQAIDRLHKLSTQPIDDMFAGLSSDSPVLTLGATTKTEKPSVSKLNRNKSINSASKLSRQPTLLAPVKKMSIRVYVEHLQRYHTVSVPVEGAAKHAISAMVDQNIIELDSEWTLFESIKQFGIERPLCDWEVIKGIMRQWDIAEGTVDLNRANSIHSAGGRPSTSSALTLGGPSSSHSGYQFIVKKYTNRPLLSLPDGVPARPPSIEGWLKYRNKKNKWEKEFFYLCGLELGFWKDQKKKDGQTHVLSLANHDLYIPSNRIKGAPNKHVFVLKSEEALSMFENPESDYIRVFAAPKAENLELWFSQLRMAKNLLWYQDRRSAEKKMSRNASGNADGAHLNIDIDIDDSGYITDGGADRVILDRDSISLSGVVVADTEDTQLRRMASQSRLKRNKSINVAASVPSTAIGADNLGSNSGAGGLGGSGLIQLAGGVQRTATLTRTKSQTRPGANGPTLLSLQQSTSSEGGVAAAAAVLRRGQTKAAAKKYAEGATKPGRDFLGLDIGGGGSDLQSEFFSAVTKRSGSINSNSASNNANAQQAIDPSTLLSLNFDFGPSTTVSSANATSGGLSRSKSVKNKPSSNSQQGGVFAPGSLLSQREEGEHSASVNPRPSTDRIGTDIASDLISTGGAHHRRRPSELNTGRSGPLVDLTAPSLFSQGSLLSRRERSGTVSNSQGNNPPTGALPRLPEDGPLLPSFSSQSASATPHQTATNASQQERVPNQPLLMADLRPEESHTQSLLQRSGTTRLKPLLNFEPGSYQSAPQSAPTAFPDASDE
ncbi:hypothetical protein GQ42DRAFT_35925 [Ramicandelaber brevisporus]|nr:hypothetical protein GQ42DRAFT_35925 [Ramicandelaber brevisporus]